MSAVTTESVLVQRVETPALSLSNADTGLNRPLSRAQRRVMAVIVDPTTYAMTDVERFTLARVSKTRWYETLKNPHFARVYRETAQAAVMANASAVLQKSFKTAIERDRDGFNDRRMLLEMGNLYTPRQQIDHTTAGQPIVGVVGVDPSSL